MRSSASRNTSWLPTGGLSRCACSSIQREKLNAVNIALLVYLTPRDHRPAVHLQEMQHALADPDLRGAPRWCSLRALPALQREEPARRHRRHPEPARPPAGDPAARLKRRSDQGTVSQALREMTQKDAREPAVERHIANALVSAKPWFSPRAQPQPGVPASGSSATARHLREWVFNQFANCTVPSSPARVVRAF